MKSFYRIELVVTEDMESTTDHKVEWYYSGNPVGEPDNFRMWVGILITDHPLTPNEKTEVSALARKVRNSMWMNSMRLEEAIKLLDEGIPFPHEIVEPERLYG